MTHLNSDGIVSDGFAQLMVILAEAFGGRLTDTKIKTYAALLADVPLDALAVGFHRCARELDARFLPADPESRIPTVSQIMPFLRPSEAEGALLAWAAVRRAVSVVGAYESLSIDDASTAMALMTAVEDWPTFCALEEGPALAAVKNVFCAAYKQAHRALQTREATRFAGLHEQKGHYLPGARVWVGHLLADGRVEHERERPKLAAAPVINQLTQGEQCPTPATPPSPSRAHGRKSKHS